MTVSKYLLGGLVVDLVGDSKDLLGILCVSGARLASVLGLEDVKCLETNMELGRAVELSEIRNQELWLLNRLLEARLFVLAYTSIELRLDSRVANKAKMMSLWIQESKRYLQSRFAWAS